LEELAGRSHYNSIFSIRKAFCRRM